MLLLAAKKMTLLENVLVTAKLGTVSPRLVIVMK